MFRTPAKTPNQAPKLVGSTGPFLRALPRPLPDAAPCPSSTVGRTPRTAYRRRAADGLGAPADNARGRPAQTASPADRILLSRPQRSRRRRQPAAVDGEVQDERRPDSARLRPDLAQPAAREQTAARSTGVDSEVQPSRTGGGRIWRAPTRASGNCPAGHEGADGGAASRRRGRRRHLAVRWAAGTVEWRARWGLSGAVGRVDGAEREKVGKEKRERKREEKKKPSIFRGQEGEFKRIASLEAHIGDML